MSILLLDTNIISDMMRNLEGRAATRAREASVHRGTDALYTSIVAGLLAALLVEFAVAPRIVARENLKLWHSLGSDLGNRKARGLGRQGR